jgi:hypothetical protein
MSDRWAAWLPFREPNPAAGLRLFPGIEVHQSAERFWLRGESLDADLELRLRQLPDALLFDVLPDNQLRRQGSRVPRGWLPEGPWSEIGKWFTVELPVARLGGQGARRTKLELVRSQVVRPANLLMIHPSDWLAFADAAPGLRLAPLSFALAGDDRVLVRGTPLPPLPGTPFYEQARLALPCGWSWQAGIDAATVRAALGLEASDWALFSPAGSWERIAEDDFVRATRSAVRTSIPAECD